MQWVTFTTAETQSVVFRSFTVSWAVKVSPNECMFPCFSKRLNRKQRPEEAEQVVMRVAWAECLADLEELFGGSMGPIIIEVQRD